MGFLYLLEKIRIPAVNEFMLLITRLGEETAFLVVALLVFWCVDKRQGYYVLSVGFLGTLCNQFLKLLCRVPRPWVLDENFTILEQAREAATGYSFPSGHSQSAVGTFGAVAYTNKNKLIRLVCVLICILVPFSRMYIGVHTPSDVLVAAGMAILFMVILHPLVYKWDGKYFPALLAGLLALTAAYLAYVELHPFPADIDAHNMQSAVKNAYTLIGCMAGLIVVYIVDTKYLRFSTKAVLWAQAAKFLLGLLVVLAVKEGLRAPLESLFNGHIVARSVRYFLIVVVAGAVWPISFRFFGKFGKGK